MQVKSKKRVGEGMGQRWGTGNKLLGGLRNLFPNHLGDDWEKKKKITFKTI